MSTPTPTVVSPDEWRQARDELLIREKKATRELDAIAAERRRLPMVEVTKPYAFDTPDGTKSLLDLFDGRDQLLTYQFMDAGPDAICPGCTAFSDNVPPGGLTALARHGVSWATVTDLPLAQLEPYAASRGWTMPLASSRGTTFAADCGAGGGFIQTAFLRTGDAIYRTYTTEQRGVDRLLFVHNLIDLTVYGRQEAWEDSPEGWPQS